MPAIIKIIWIIAVIVVFVSLMWFLLGTTSFFRRGIDLPTTYLFITVWTPALLFTILSVILLTKGWIPASLIARIGLLAAVILFSLAFSSTLFKNVNTQGWLSERVKIDYTQITDDEKYEYRIEIVNMFQRNSYVRLHVKNASSSEEFTIILDIPIREIGAVQGGEESQYPEPVEPDVWSELVQTASEDIYTLTTKDRFDRHNIYVFEVDMSEKIAMRVR